MTEDMAQLLLFALVILSLTPLLGRYMCRVYAGERVLLTPVVAPLERLICRVGGIDARAQQRWTRYALSAITLNFVGALCFYIMLRIQHLLPLNPRGFGPMEPALAFNTAISFITSTGWQAYAGESTLSYLSQMAGCTVLSFIGAATAMAVAIAVMRGLVTTQTKTLGNFQVDFLRTHLYILLPISLIAALFLVFEGVPQTLGDYVTVTTMEGAEQIIPQGPVASQTAIKMLGTNGGGFFNANAAHPYENPTPLSNFVQTVLMLLIPAALTYTFGLMARDTRQGWALFSAMAIFFVLGLFIVYAAEKSGNPLLAALPIDQSAGNFEGKEVRFGIAASALWAVAATTTACGAVNAVLDSFTPLGGMVLMLNAQLREAVFGGAGAGFLAIIPYVVLAVFIAGLMIGRSAAYLGKKIELREIRLTVLALLIVPLGMLLLPAIATMIPSAVATLRDRGPHGLSELLYAYASATSAKGSAFAGFKGASTFNLTAIGLGMLAGRFAVIVAGLAIAGSLGAKRTAVVFTGAAPTTTPLFVAIMVGVIVLFGAVCFLPAIALGPLAEHFEMLRGRTF
jgi:K+-transporting ATPase ATPase A chain